MNPVRRRCCDPKETAVAAGLPARTRRRWPPCGGRGSASICVRKPSPSNGCRSSCHTAAIPRAAAAKAIREFTVFRHARRHAQAAGEGLRLRGQDHRAGQHSDAGPSVCGGHSETGLPGEQVELVLEIRDIYARPELFEYNSIRRRLEVFKESLLIRQRGSVHLPDRRDQEDDTATYYPRLSSVRDGVVITNGYDPEEYGPPPGGRRPIRFAGHRLLRVVLCLAESRTAVRGAAAVQDRSLRHRRRCGCTSGANRAAIPWQAKIAEYGLQEAVIYHGICSHEDIIRRYAGTGVNLIITHTMGSSYALPGKLFEYVGAARPIWAITDDRDPAGVHRPAQARVSQHAQRREHRRHAAHDPGGSRARPGNAAGHRPAGGIRDRLASRADSNSS